jgi:cytoskeletal protein RodZ
MAFEVHCKKCSARFTLPDDLFERKVKGRVVTVRCRKCQADISVDGIQLSQPPPAPELTPTVPLGKAKDLTPTVPLAKTEPKPVTPSAPFEGLWLVSFGDDDDRELSAAQIKKALASGEIDLLTIVWNSQMDDWKPIGEVPELGGGAPDATGGFLGTGANVTAVVHEPALRHSSRPPPAPGNEENALLGDDEVGPFRSVSAGTLFVEDDVEPISAEPISIRTPAPKAPEVKRPPPPRREAKPDGPTSNPPPKPKLPQAPKKLQPDWLAEAKPEDDEPPPSSQGTPNLKDLTHLAPKPVRDEPAPPPKEVDDILGVGGGGVMAGIDLTNLPPPVSSRPPPAAAEEQATPSSKRRSKRPAASSRPGKRSEPPKPEAKKEEKKDEAKSSGMIWLVVAGLGVIAIWWLFFRPPSEKTETPPPTASAEPSRTVETAATTQKSSAPVENQPVLDLPENPATPPANQKPTPTGEKPPTEKPEPKEPTEKKEPTPTTKPEEGSEVDMAPPFDKSAAVAALNSAAGAASSCRQEGDPSGTATVVVTFAPSGRVTSANLSGPPFAGTKTGGCIAARMRSAKIPAFSGSHMTVSKTVVIQ